jgi:hypothetical protein
MPVALFWLTVAQVSILAASAVLGFKWSFEAEREERRQDARYQVGTPKLRLVH